MFISLLLPNKDTQGEQEGIITKKFWACRHCHPQQTNQMKRKLRIHGLFSGEIFNLFFKCHHGKVHSVQNQEECQASMRSKTKFWFLLNKLINNCSKDLSILTCFMARIWSMQIANILIPLNKIKYKQYWYL